MKREIVSRKTLRFSLVLLLFGFCFAGTFLSFGTPRQANATCACTGCIPGDVPAAQQIITEFHDIFESAIMEWISNEMTQYRDWLTDTFFLDQVLPALQMMTEQLSAVGMQQVFIFGTFLDAKQQLETQRLFQELQFEAQRDYQPSEDFCWFGTNVRSLGASEHLGKLNAASLEARQMKRHLGNVNIAGSESRDQEKANRWQQFITDYCDIDDNNRINGTAGTGLQLVCANGPKRVNNDIDFTRMIDEKRTLNVAFNNDVLTPDEEDVMAIGNNLYGHDVLTRLADDEYLRNEQYQHLYLALRSVAAKRSVAENSYNSIVALKSAGPEDMAGASRTRDFLASVLQELGVPPAEIFPMIGEQPSYYAQLEILAKKIYQNPDFFAGLYDSPANVERKSVALKAVELMLDRAIYESQLRQEMATSVLLSSRLRPLELKVDKDLAGGKQ